jgi:hypothetical protein
MHVFFSAVDAISANRCTAMVSRHIAVFMKILFGRMDVQIMMASNALDALLEPGFGRHGEGAVV